MSEIPGPENTPITPQRVHDVEVVVPPQLRDVTQPEVMDLWNSLSGETASSDKLIGLEQLLRMFQGAAELGYKFAAPDPHVDVVMPPQLRHISQTETMKLWNSLSEGIASNDRLIGSEQLSLMFQQAAEFGYKFAALEPPVDAGAAWDVWDNAETQPDE